MGLRPEVTRWRHDLEVSGGEVKVDWRILACIMEQESGGNPLAHSGAGAYGLMQLTNPAGLGVKDWRNGAENIRGGAHEFASDLRAFNNSLALALAAYNAGIGAVQRYKGIPPYPETQAYVRAILANIREVTKADYVLPPASGSLAGVTGSVQAGSVHVSTSQNPQDHSKKVEQTGGHFSREGSVIAGRVTQIQQLRRRRIQLRT